MTKSRQRRNKSSDLWRLPMDLTPELASRVLHGLAENHRHRLELLARQGGRASMVDLLGVTNDSDLRILSYFQGALSRKICPLRGVTAMGTPSHSNEYPLQGPIAITTVSQPISSS